MADNEQFLSRWARLKQETQRSHDPEALPAVVPSDAAVDAGAAAACGAPDVSGPQEPEPFDPATLPPLESIDAGSDITAFLARNVPADLVKAALRRAWAADPAIRDFVGLSENSWDFTATDGVPGFGPMRAGDDVRQMLALINRRSESVAEAIESVDAVAPSEPQGEIGPGGKTSQVALAESDEAVDTKDSEAQPAVTEQRHSNQSRDKDVAAHDQNIGSDFVAVPRRRPHGGALPE